MDRARFLAKQLFVSSGHVLVLWRELMRIEEAASRGETTELLPRLRTVASNTRLREELHQYHVRAGLYPEPHDPP